MSWNQLTRGLGAATLILFLVSAFSPLWNTLGRALSDHRETGSSEAIVVLGSGFLGVADLNYESLRRAVHGIRFYQRGSAPLLVLSGRSDSPLTISEARLRANLAQDMGVPTAAILLEETANTTREESIRITELLRPHGVRHIILVTESLHMRRARLLFERAGFQVSSARSDEYSNSLVAPGERLWLMMRVLQEASALVYYKMFGYI
jgi:uncharacterized SAM-binding protein YcdF (DUF218 family)